MVCMKIEITPAIVVPDMSPLIHLAAAAQLPLLQAFGRVIVMDIVAYEATADLERPWARDVAAWLENGQAPGSNQPLEVVKTEIGGPTGWRGKLIRASGYRMPGSARSGTGWSIPCRRWAARLL
jgi:hypothetical protein